MNTPESPLRQIANYFAHDRLRPSTLALAGIVPAWLVLVAGCPNPHETSVPTAPPAIPEPAIRTEEPLATTAPVEAAEYDTHPLLAPLKLRMTKEEVRRALPDYSAQAEDELFLVMVSPSHLAPGADVVVPSGLHALIAYDENDRVRYVSTMDRSLRLRDDIGVGSSYGYVLQQTPEPSVSNLRGYGTCVHVSGTAWACLLKESGEEVTNDDVIEWIEFRPPE